MLSLEDELIILSNFGVYRAQLADQIDPLRTDINLPPIIQQQILSHGGDALFIAQTLGIAGELFDTHHLGEKFPKVRALKLALDAAHDLAAMTEICSAFKKEQADAIETLNNILVATNSLTLPAIPSLKSRIESFVGHSRAACLSLIAIVSLFYPKSKSNDKWRTIVECGMAKYLENVAEAREPFKSACDVVELMNNLRNAIVHPDKKKHATISNFKIVPGVQFVKPRVEIVMRDEVIVASDIDYFMDTMLQELGDTFECMCALLCDANVKSFGPVETRVSMQPLGNNGRASRYVYSSWLKEGVVLEAPRAITTATEQS